MEKKHSPDFESHPPPRVGMRGLLSPSTHPRVRMSIQPDALNAGHFPISIAGGLLRTCTRR